MKRTVLTIVFSLIIAMSVSAQGGRDIYSRYSDKAGVSAVYISPAMFRMMDSLPEVEIGDTDVDFKNIITTFEGMYILDVENVKLAAQLGAEVEEMVRKGRYELLMEAKEDDEKMRIYVAVEKDIVTDFIMLAMEPDETSVISITGRMPSEDIRKLLAKNTGNAW